MISQYFFTGAICPRTVFTAEGGRACDFTFAAHPLRRCRPAPQLFLPSRGKVEIGGPFCLLCLSVSSFERLGTVETQGQGSIII